MPTNFSIWGTDGWKFLVSFLGDSTGISSAIPGYNLQIVRAINAAIRAENRANRQQCWMDGNFVRMGGACVEDPEVGVAQALKQLNGDSQFEISDLRRQRLEGYVANQFYREWGEAVESGQGSDIQNVIDKYGQYPDVMATNPFIGGLSFSLMNPQNVLDRMILGDSDWGVTVQMCTSTVTTNCVDPKAINDIWEDFGRHIQVIFKGLEIPGLPEWLPLPGIMRLPTIGEIWDKVSGPFNDAAREQMQECMAQDDDGDGVNNTASYCMENRDIVGIITQGIGDGVGEIADATADEVRKIVDKALETFDCVIDPAACAEEVKKTIEGVFGGIDPTQPGIPPWMRAIIIGGQYGDEILRELEKIFNEDINGDGTIGIGPEEPEFGYCQDGVTEKADAEGTNCQEYAEFGYCEDGTTKKQDAQGTNCSEYAPNGYCEDGVTKKDNPEGTNCEEYETPLTPEEQQCNEQGRVFNDITGECEETCANPEHVVGADGNCGPDDSTDGGTDVDCNSPRPSFDGSTESQYAQKAWTQLCGGTNCPQDGSLISDHVDNDCDKGLISDEVDDNPSDDELCNGPRPPQTQNDKNYCFAQGYAPCPEGTEEYQNGRWYKAEDCTPIATETCEEQGLVTDPQTEECLTQDAFCAKYPDAEGCVLGPQEGEPCDSTGDGQNDGTIVNGECVATTEEECTKPDGTPTGATPESGCEQCPQGFTFDFNGICQPDSGFSCDDYNKTTNEDGTCGPCKEGYQIDTSLPNEPCVKIFDGCSPGFELVNGQCTAIVCPEGQSYCIDTDGCVDIGTCPSDPPEEEGGDAGGGGGGRSMFQPYSFAISADPQLLSRSEFPITDFLAGIFTNSRGGRNV